MGCKLILISAPTSFGKTTLLSEWLCQAEIPVSWLSLDEGDKHRVTGINFIEHGLSNDPQVQVWQHRLTPIQKVIADGCHFNRDIKRLIENQFSQVTIEQFQGENLPKIVGYLYKGVAVKD